MPWLKSASEFPENDKVWPLSSDAYRLYDAMRHYCARKLTDGHVPTSRISALMPRPPKKELVAEILDARLIHRTADICASCIRWRAEKKVMDPLPKGGYIVHDYLEYNPPRWWWEALAEKRKRAGAAGGQASAQARAEAHGQADAQAFAQPSAEASAQALAQAKPKPVPRIPFSVPGAIAPVPSDGDPFADADRSRDQVRRGGRRGPGLRHVGDIAAEVVERHRPRAAS